MSRIATLSLFFFATFLQSGAYGLTFLLPDLFQDFGANEKVVGQMLGITAIVTLGSIGVSGHVTDRTGRLPALALASGLLATALFLFALPSDVGGALIAASALLGAGWGLSYALSPVVLTRLVPPEHRVRYFTVLAMSMMAGFGLSPVVADTLIGFGAGLDQVFYLYGGTLLLAGVIFMGLKAPVARHAFIESEPRSRITIGAINRVLASRAWVSVVLGLLSGSVFAGMNNFQTVISSSRALNYADYFLTYTLTVIILRVFLIRYNGGQNPYRTLGVLLMLMASSPLLLLFSGGSQMLYVVVAMLFGLGYGTSYPIISAMAANDALEDLTAQTLLVFSFAHFIGVFGFPLVAGWIIVEMGIPILLGLVVALAAIEAGLAFARSYKPK